jgi:hypothetical protein
LKAPVEATSDERSVAETVDRAYELISFAAGGAPRWDEFRRLFTQPCVLALRVFPGDTAVTVMDMDAYVRTQMREGLSDEGYTEMPGTRTITIIGDVATVTQSFEMQFAAGAPVPAVDAFSLARLQGAWHIAAIVSDTVSLPVPGGGVS